ncbi:ATP-binding cassette domain-containing protein [uncultured Roseovarius sp.]|uniref:ATP-binding cassette domain-containing protein n=1 Tax=uncultured Roseovarius sp. TaxID=293344 RepID=UPI00260F855F|nr:ATP-binding cassette domain-containing protein [uncultured Roseovarius sp.]
MVELTFKNSEGETQTLNVEAGRALYILGPNGSGKSTLLLQWARGKKNIKLIPGNRDVMFPESAVSMTAKQAVDEIQNEWNWVSSEQSRTTSGHHNGQHWLKAMLYRLKAREDFANAEYVRQDQEGNEDLKKKLLEEIPLKLVNETFSAASLPITFRWDKDSVLKVDKIGVDGSYDFNEMSDGERAAFIVATQTILAEEGNAILVDEPERHLHRAISAPLLSHLRELRPDLAWVVATHDVSLPRADPLGSVLLLYGKEQNGWRSEFIADVWQLAPAVSEAIYGARERVIFVEGETSSLDLPIYSAVYANCTVLAAGSCRDVVNAASGLSSMAQLHHMEARGLVDHDNLPNADQLIAKGVYPIPFYAIESVYYHPDVIDAIRQLSGSEASLENLCASACGVISEGDMKRLAKDAAYKAFAARISSGVPSFADFDVEAQHLGVTANPSQIYEEKLAQFEELVAQGNWLGIIESFKIKSLKSPKRISDDLAYKCPEAYETVVRKRLVQDPELLERVRGMLPQPF